MIKLDFDLIDPRGHIEPGELLSVTEAEIATELFQCYLTFEVNGTELSWRVSIPMVDFARSMFRAASSLHPDSPVALFSSAEYPVRWTFELSDSHVLISRDDDSARGRGDRAELVRSTAQFGVRVYNALREALPVMEENAFLVHWYPYDEMKRMAQPP